MYAQLGAAKHVPCRHRGETAIAGVPLCAELRELPRDRLQYRTVPGGDPANARTGFVPDGDAGTFFTLGIMRDLVLADAPLLVKVARAIVGDAAGDPREAVRRIRAFLLTHVRFTFDPDALELLQSPIYQLHAISDHHQSAGDCDDIATLGAALGLAAGLPARFVVLRFEPNGPWEHVLTELQAAGRWTDLDTSRELQRVPASVKPAASATFYVGGSDVVLSKRGRGGIFAV